MGFKKIAIAFLPLLLLFYIMPNVNAFTLNINSGNTFHNGDYWSYTSAYESSSSSSTWSAEVDTGNSAYSPSAPLNEHYAWNWGDGTTSELGISTGDTGLNSYSGTVGINDVSYNVNSGQLANYPYTSASANPSGSSSCTSNMNDAPTAFSSYTNGNGNVVFQMYHTYSATGIYSIYIQGYAIKLLPPSCGINYNSQTIQIAIINPPSVSAPTLSTPALDYGSSSGESITVSFNCGSNTICANDYISDTVGNLYSASNVNSPSTYPATQSSTSSPGAYYPSGQIYNPLTGSNVQGPDIKFIIFPALSTPALSVSGTAASVPTQLTISVPIQSSYGNEASPQAFINWGDGSTSTQINSGSSQWSVSGSNYVATVSHTYSSGSYTITTKLESANYVDYGSQYGTTSSASKSITISPYVNPAVSVAIPNSNTCVSGIWTAKSGSYTFTTTEGSFPTSYMNINWGDGTSTNNVQLSGNSQSISESHTYSTSGSYTISANIYDTNGREGSGSSSSFNVNSFQNPSIGSISPTSATATQSTTFSVSVRQGTCPLTNINWNWGDGNSNSAGAFSGTDQYAHTYSIAQGQTTATPTLTVQVSDNSGDTESTSSAISVSYVYPAIGAITPTSVYASGSQYGADYTNVFSTTLSAGTNPLSSITWNWGDGTASTTNSAVSGTNTASHAYSGSSTLSVQATDTANHYQTATQSITVNPYPIFSISSISNASVIYEGVSEAFNITTTEASGGFPLSKITWNWGDNTAPTPVNNPSYGLNSEQHTYSATGTYTVSVNVYDSNGATLSTSEVITVSAYNPPKLTNFYITNYTNVTTGITAGLPSTYYINLTQGNYTVESLTFNWGDGTSTFFNATTSPPMIVNGTDSVSHIYSTAGAYTLTITATDSLGYSGTSQASITVNNYTMPIIQSFSPLQAIVNQTQNYNVAYLEGSIPLQNLTINFNGANVINNQISQTGGTSITPYSMSQVGNVPVTATLCDALNNCTAHTYTVYNQLLPIITAFYHESYNGNNYNKINTTFVINLTEGSNPLANLTMYFGDGNTQFINLNNASSASLVLNNSYSTGTYSPYFTVYDSNGNSETSSTLVVPISNYIYGYVTSITPSNVYDVITDSFLFNLTQGSFPMQNVTVDWEDGSANTTANVPTNATNITIQHTYPFATNASYNVIATACDVNFCTAYGQLINTSYVLPQINSVSPTSVYETVPTNFTFNITKGTFALNTIEIAWGISNATTFLPINSNFTYNFTYNATGTYTLTAYVSDVNGQSSNAFTQIITVLPYVYPYVSSLTPTSVIAGENVSYNFTAIQGTFPLSNVSINWGNGQTFIYNVTNGSNTVNHLYTENGNFTVTETIYDTRGITPSTPTSTIIAVSPAPYTFTTSTPIMNYTITNQSRPLNIIYSLNYTGNATLVTSFITQQDNIINNFVCSQSISPNPSQIGINPENITLSLLCTINPNAISLSPQTLFLTTYAQNTAGIFESITEQVNINTTVSLPQIPTPFNMNETVSTPYPVRAFTPLDLGVIMAVMGVLVLFILIWFR